MSCNLNPFLNQCRICFLWFLGIFFLVLYDVFTYKQTWNVYIFGVFHIDQLTRHLQRDLITERRSTRFRLSDWLIGFIFRITFYLALTLTLFLEILTKSKLFKTFMVNKIWSFQTMNPKIEFFFTYKSTVEISQSDIPLNY